MNYFYLVIIDVLNKYVWVESLRDKTSNLRDKNFPAHISEKRRTSTHILANGQGQKICRTI